MSEVASLPVFPPDLVVTWWLRAWDWAFTKKTANDHSCGLLVGKTNDWRYVIAHMEYFQTPWPQTKATMRETLHRDARMGQPVDLVLPTQGIQVGMVDELEDEEPFNTVQIYRVPEQIDKLSRANRWISILEAGRIFLVDGPWNEEFLRVCEKFTGQDDREDDIIDAMSMAHVVFAENSPPGVYAPAPTKADDEKNLDTRQSSRLDRNPTNERNDRDADLSVRRRSRRRRTFL